MRTPLDYKVAARKNAVRPTTWAFGKHPKAAGLDLLFGHIRFPKPATTVDID